MKKVGLFEKIVLYGLALIVALIVMYVSEVGCTYPENLQVFTKCSKHPWN